MFAYFIRFILFKKFTSIVKLRQIRSFNHVFQNAPFTSHLLQNCIGLFSTNTFVTKCCIILCVIVVFDKCFTFTFAYKKWTRLVSKKFIAWYVNLPKFDERRTKPLSGWRRYYDFAFQKLHTLHSKFLFIRTFSFVHFFRLSSRAEKYA